MTPSPGRSTKEDAQLLFDEGLRYMLEGDLKMGCALLKQSLDIDPRPGTLFTVAECYARAGKFASAVQYYDEYMNVYSQLPTDEQAKQKARAEVSQNERSRLVKQVPWVTVVLPMGAPEGVIVTMDDEPFPSNLFGVAIALDPGKHWFTARIPGGPLARSEIEVQPGTRRTHQLELPRTDEEAAEPEPEPMPPDESSPSKGRSPWVYVLGGVGVAGLATGTVTGVMLLNARSKILNDCKTEGADGTKICTSQDAVDAADRAQNTLAPITTVAFGVGVGALAAATILWFVDAPKPASADRGVSARANVGLGYASVSVSGQF
jgi:hypothetical protein